MKQRKHLPLFLLFAVLSACSTTHEGALVEEAEGEGWAVTAWGDHFEIFAEADPLEVAAASIAYTHVTNLEGFSPVSGGTVSVVLRDASGAEVTFSENEPTRAGIFSVPVTPATSGEFDLLFRIETPERREEIPAGRVRVAEAGSGGGLVEPAPMTAMAEATATGSPISFLKEQQWRTEFSTVRIGSGSLSESVRGPGLVRPAAGGEVLLTSPVDGIVSGARWPYPGHEVQRGAAVFRVVPRVASNRSLAGLGADVAGLEADLDAVRHRRERLEGLLELGATSRREFEEVKARETTLESRLAAAQRNLATAGAARRGDATAPDSIVVTAPFAGRIARVDTTRGQVVAAGDPLGLLVRERPLWVAVALRPEAAAGLGATEGLELRLPNRRSPLTFRADEARLVSLSPVVDPQTGTVTALFEVAAGVEDLPIGSRLEAEVLLAGERVGVVVPRSALIDDGGVTVAYLQTGGESFVRVEVRVVARQSGRALVEGLPAGSRLVERGGNAIRRATLVSRDVGEGHVH